MARAAHAMAMASPLVQADVIEAQEFPELIARYQITGVPKTVINDRLQVAGAVPEERFLARVLEAAGLTLEEAADKSAEAPTTSL